MDDIYTQSELLALMQMARAIEETQELDEQRLIFHKMGFDDSELIQLNLPYGSEILPKKVLCH